MSVRRHTAPTRTQAVAVHLEQGPDGFTVVAEHDRGVTVIAVRADNSFVYATMSNAEADFVTRSLTHRATAMARPV